MFSSIKNSVQKRFEDLLRGELFVVDLEKNQLFDAYLDSFSLDRRQEHNCNCCRSFLNHYGNLVSIQNGVIKTLWEFEGEGEYAAVPAALADKQDANLRSMSEEDLRKELESLS